MKNLLLLILFGFFIVSVSLAQAPAIQWQKCYGGTNSDQSFSVHQTSDGGYIIGGVSRSSDGDLTYHYGSDVYNDYWLVKTDADGMLQWQKVYGGTQIERLKYVIQTYDGGYLMVGWTYSNDGDVTGTQALGDVWAVKTDTAGNIQWQKTTGGSAADDGYRVIQTADSGFVISGNSRSVDGDVSGNHGFADYWMVKLSAGGSVLWQKSFGGSTTDEESSLQQTADGGYILAGTSYSNNGDVSGHHGSTSTSDCWVLKTDSARNIVWQHSYGGTYSEGEFELKIASDGGYIITGLAHSNDGDVSGHHGTTSTSDVWVLKLDTAGNLLWQKSYGGTGNDEGLGISVCSDGGYIIAGSTASTDGDVTSNNGITDYWLIKIDSLGNIQWQKTMGGTLDDEAMAVEQTIDGGFIVTGFTQSNDVDVSGNHGDVDIWLVKLAGANGISQSSSSDFPGLFFPNPFHSNITLRLPQTFAQAELRIYNAQGKEVRRQMIREKITVFNRNGMSNGVYYFEVINDNGEIECGKIIIE